MWPPIAQHYNQAPQNVHRFPSRLNTQISNPQTVILSQFSKPLRFPINENESDFVPIVGQGVKLPKPAPESLITPSSIIDYDKQNFPLYSLQPPTVASSYLPLQNQEDSYAFFNLDTFPKFNDNHVVNVGQEQLAKTNISTSATPSILKPLPANTFVNEDQLVNQNKTINTLEQTYLQVRPEKESSNTFKGHTDVNLVASTTISDETQVASPNNEENLPIGNSKSVESSYNSHQLENESKPNYKQHSTNRPSYSTNVLNNIKANSDSHLSSNRSHNYKFEVDKDELYSTEHRKGDGRETQQNKKPMQYGGFLYDQSSGNSNSEISQYISPRSKESNRNLKEEFINNHGTFSDSKTDFDNYFYELPGPTKQIHTKITIHHIKPPQEEHFSSRIKLPKIKLQNQKLPSPNIRNKNYKNVKPKNNSENVLVGEHNYNTSLTNTYQTQLNGKNKIVLPSSTFSKNSEISGNSDYSVVRAKDYDNESPTIQTNTPKYSDRNRISSTKNNHRYNDYSKVEPPLSLSYSDYSPNYDGFRMEHNSSNHSLSMNLMNTRETPNIYRVHRQNSMPDKQYKEDLPESEEEEEYDDEDYYGTDEEYDYSDEYSTDNNKSINNEEYDEASVEEEDETNSSSKRLKVSFKKNQLADCNKMFKNHRCNPGVAEETYYEDENSNNSEEYDYIEKENGKPKKPVDGQYKVTENLAETQQKAIIEINKKEQAKQSVKPLLHKNSKSSNVNHTNSSISQSSRTNETNIFSKIPIPIVHNLKQNNKPFQKVKSLPADPGSSNKPLNTGTHYIVNSGLTSRPTFKNTTLSQYPNSHLGQTEKRYNSQRPTYEKAKLHSSSTLPLNPKPLRHMRQRPLTKPTNLTSSSDLDISDRPKPLLTTFDSHLTNSLTVQG